MIAIESEVGDRDRKIDREKERKIERERGKERERKIERERERGKTEKNDQRYLVVSALSSNLYSVIECQQLHDDLAGFAILE